jgi:hypothetical protein
VLPLVRVIDDASLSSLMKYEMLRRGCLNALGSSSIVSNSRTLPSRIRRNLSIKCRCSPVDKRFKGGRSAFDVSRCADGRPAVLVFSHERRPAAPQRGCDLKRRLHLDVLPRSCTVTDHIAIRFQKSEIATLRPLNHRRWSVRLTFALNCGRAGIGRRPSSAAGWPAACWCSRFTYCGSRMIW